MKRRIDVKAEQIEESHGRKLTNRQKTFARHFVDGTKSNAECARLAGYSDKNGIAKIQAHKLLNAKYFPHVAEYVLELREERERKYGVTRRHDLLWVALSLIGGRQITFMLSKIWTVTKSKADFRNCGRTTQAFL